jgi:YD repeat-containing protein
MPADLDVDDLGNVYFAGNGSVRKVSSDGTISTVVRMTGTCWNGDGQPVGETCMTAQGVTVDRAGNLYVMDNRGGPERVRMVSVDGRVTTIAGGGPVSGWDAHGAPATRVGFCMSRTAVAPNGTIYVATEPGDLWNSWGCEGWGVYRIAPTMPGFSGAEVAMASPDGGELYRLSASGRHLETKSTRTGATTHTLGYNADGKLTTITDGDGNVTAIQRDANGNPTAIMAPHGQTTTLALDAHGYLAAATNPAGETTQFTYSDSGLMASKTTPRGHTSTFQYSGLGRLEEDRSPDGATQFLGLVLTNPDETTYAVRHTSAESRVTVYGIERLANGGMRQQNTFPTGLATDSTFNPDGTNSLTFPDGSSAASTLGPDPRWAMVAPLTQATSFRMPTGLTRSQSANRAVTLADPNNPLNLTQQADTFVLNGKTTTAVYTGATRLETTTSPVGRVTKRWIDAQGRTMRVEAPGIAPVDYTYDAQGRLGTVTQGAAPDARITGMAYNPQGYLASVTDPLSRTTSFSHDLAGRILQQSLPGGRTVQFGYDANGNLTSIVPPGRTAHLFGFTPVDETASYTPPDLGLGSPTTSYQYNLDRQLAKVIRPDGQTIVMGYDSAGRLGTITTPTGVTTYTYSPTTGTLSSIAAPGGVGLSYTWDGSLPMGTTWGGPIAGSVTRTYNNDFDVASITIAGTQYNFMRDNDRLLTGAGAMTITRDATTGFVTGTTLGTVTTGYTHSSFGELASTSASYSGSAIFATSYTRDALGRITDLVETVQGVTTAWGYEYNAAGQLWRVRENGLQVAEYQYDLNGNRTSATDELGVTTSGTYDAQDRLSTYGPTSYSYTLNGELQNKAVPGVGTTTLSYDVLGNLRGATLADGRGCGSHPDQETFLTALRSGASVSSSA